MFNECILPAGFSLGPNFDTSEVTNMVYMFKDCELPAGFSFGDRFNTSKVINMRTMFYRCHTSSPSKQPIGTLLVSFHLLSNIAYIIKSSSYTSP